SRVHVHNVRVCYLCILIPRCFCVSPVNEKAPENLSVSSI
uniref:Uncharacterized protein n=1 Tax=Macaca fascicularis TaxID=9541 RepID=A0A7N9CR44_MACFA